MDEKFLADATAAIAIQRINQHIPPGVAPSATSIGVTSGIEFRPQLRVFGAQPLQCLCDASRRCVFDSPPGY
jgi:hypothetical protein